MRFLGAKCVKNAFAAVGGAYSAPDPLAGFKGPASKGMGGQGRVGEERRGKGRGREWKGAGGERGEETGKGRERVIPVLRALSNAQLQQTR